MAAVTRKTSKAAKKKAPLRPTKATYDGKTLLIVFGTDPDTVQIETPDAIIQCDLEEFVLPTQEELEEAINELLEA